MTSGAPTLENDVGTIESLKGFIKVLRTVDEAGIINGCGAFRLGDVLKHQAYQDAHEKGLNI